MVPMSRKWRVCTALSHQQPDKVPWSLSITEHAGRALADYAGDERLADPAYLHEWAGEHLGHVTPTSGGQFHVLEEEVSPGLWRDGWGIVWDTRGLFGEGEWGRPVNAVLERPSLQGFRFPDPPRADAYTHYTQAIAQQGDRFILGNEGHLFEVAWALRGIEDFLADMASHPEFVQDLLEGITEYYLDVIDRTMAFDVDAMAFGEDWGSQNSGLLMGPRLWRQFIKPCLARLFARVKAAGKFVHIHSDGDVTAIFPDLIEIGLDVYNPLQPEIMDVYEVKRRYGDKLSFHGGLGVQSILPFGTPQEVKAEVRRLLREVGAGGGYILSPSHGITADTPPQNIMAFIEAVQEQ
ncbi:MAG: uroporphyrinogen decarboxylase family protein [Anaerolineae bacterium]